MNPVRRLLALLVGMGLFRLDVAVRETVLVGAALGYNAAAAFLAESVNDEGRRRRRARQGGTVLVIFTMRGST